MHGFVPLSRCIDGALHPLSSRIPHLTVHIVRRQARSAAHTQTKWPARSHRRTQHSAATLGFPSVAVDSSFFPHEQDEPRSNSSKSESIDLLATDAQPAPKKAIRRLVSIEDLLEDNNPERIIFGLVTPSIGDLFVAAANDEAFSKAICALKPDHFIVPFREVHHYIKPTLETEPRFRYLRSFEERASVFYQILDALVTLREERGHALTLDVYRHLLRCAAAGGNADMARNIFRKTMPENNVTPDVACYNYFMEALNWNRTYGRYERYTLRVVPTHLHFRSIQRRRSGFAGHMVASPGAPNNPESIRLEALTIFNELVRQGLKGDEATFCNLITAMGREGDVSSVKSVLKSVWNIDVDALERYDEEEIESPTFYDLDSPLRPTERLLFTVAHTFSTNNSVSVAGMLIDYISRNYNISIPENVWTHLLEWTTVLTTQKGNLRAEHGYGAGRVEGPALEMLWTVYHDEPYNVKPKLVDHMFRLKGRIRARKFGPVLDDLRECMRLLDEDRDRVSLLYDEMRSHLDLQYDRVFKDGVPSADFLTLKQEYVLASLRLDSHIQLIITAFRQMLKTRWWDSKSPDFAKKEWPWRTIPQLLREFAEFLPNQVPYYTPTGHVLLTNGKEHREAAVLSANSTQTTKAGSMRAMFDTYSPEHLRHSADFVRRKPKGLGAFEKEKEAQDTDWVLAEEGQQREKRLKDRQYGVLNRPSATWRADEWKPWPGPPSRRV
ncbi:mitochondrial ATPase expression-domain-containing protein [Exophiala viscosa]|uniref:mitochondrial ATPase expression-domain-containing protein n=1 Tax=Exophiala viscosa TaxID=2486360 RepID=UPI00219C75AA|nr:mitochondrial ATPase expression-domain-containing protein [Exophiala viscosa]